MTSTKKSRKHPATGDTLKAFLERSEPFEVDRAAFDEHMRVMKEKVIPDIVKDLRESERVAAELRYSPSTGSRRNRKSH
jgi:hypothetical protein